MGATKHLKNERKISDTNFGDLSKFRLFCFTANWPFLIMSRLQSVWGAFFILITNTLCRRFSHSNFKKRHSLGRDTQQRKKTALMKFLD